MHISKTTPREQLYALWITRDPTMAKKASYDSKKDELFINGKYYSVDMEAKAIINRFKLIGYDEQWITSSVQRIAKPQ